MFKVFSIRDSKAEVFYPPFFKKTMGEAERDFMELTRDDKSVVCKYPEDFDLYYVGEFCDQRGVITALETPQHIIKAALIRPKVTEANA